MLKSKLKKESNKQRKVDWRKWKELGGLPFEKKDELKEAAKEFGKSVAVFLPTSAAMYFLTVVETNDTAVNFLSNLFMLAWFYSAIRVVVSALELTLKVIEHFKHPNEW